MILSDRDIQAALEAGRIVIDPLGEDAIQPSSLDVRVDDTFRVFANHRHPYIDVRAEQSDLTEVVKVDGEGPFILHPGEFVLASTYERITLADDLVIDAETERRLTAYSDPPLGRGLALAAIRELWEDTGLMLGRRGDWPVPPPPDWAKFAARGLVPSAAGLHYVFRAITPAGRPRRFDARFFLVDAARVAGDPDDFSAACEELSHLHWISLAEARQLDLPFITEVVLAEVAALVATGGRPDSVPFFDNSGPRPLFRRIA